MARHMRHYLQLLGHSFYTWSREEGPANLEKLRNASVLLLLIKDSEIESFYKEHSFVNSKPCIHFSGSMNVPGVPSFHPLCTFGDELYTLAEYEKIAFICEEGAPAFEETFPRLPNPHYTIKPEQKALYHALCVMAGNFSCILWQKLFSDFENKLGLPTSAAVPYMERLFKNLEKNPSTALTGPLQRNDITTLQSNINALNDDSYQKVYKSFVELFQP